MKSNEYENEKNKNNSTNEINDSTNEIIEDERLEYALSTCVELLRQKTGKSIIPNYIFENSLTIKTSELFRIMKENDFLSLCPMFFNIMKKFMSLMIDGQTKFIFNIEELNEVLRKMNKYIKILKDTIGDLEHSDMNCEVMLSDIKKIPSMEGIKIPKSHMPNIIHIDILNSKPGNPVGNASLTIKRIKNIKIDGKIYKDDAYCYTLYSSKSFLTFCSEETTFYINILSYLSCKFDFIDLPFQNSKRVKYRIIDDTENNHFCDDCCRNEFCRGKFLLKENYIYEEKDKELKCAIFTNSTKEYCNAFFNLDEESNSSLSIDRLYNLARYILYMYTTKNCEKVFKPIYKIDGSVITK